MNLKPKKKMNEKLFNQHHKKRSTYNHHLNNDFQLIVLQTKNHLQKILVDSRLEWAFFGGGQSEGV